MSDDLIDDALVAIEPYATNMGDVRQDAPVVPLNEYVPRPAVETESLVLTHAGARPLDRDAVDARIVAEVTARTGDVISSQDDVGGYPALAQSTTTLDVPDDPHGAGDCGEPRTRLECWLLEVAQALEP